MRRFIRLLMLLLFRRLPIKNDSWIIVDNLGVKIELNE